MRKMIVTLMASLLGCSTAFAFWPEAADSSLEVGVGYRRDKLEWKTRFDTCSSSYNSYDGNKDCCHGLPRRLHTKLRWHDLNIWQIEARGKYVTCDNIYLRANGDYGWITSGHNTDSDRFHARRDHFKDNDVNMDGNDGYDGYDSGLDFSHRRSRVRGHVYDAKIAVGYQFKWCDCTLALTPLIGYSWHGQHLHNRHGRKGCYSYSYDSCDTFTSSTDFDYSNSFDYYSYNSNNRNRNRYHTRWNGPFVGVDLEYYFGCWCDWDWQLFGCYEFHWAEYHARARRDRRRDICHNFFHRSRNAYGHYFDVGIRWDFCECWTLAVKGEFNWWWADRGRDRAKIFDCSCGDWKTKCFERIPLRDIRWQSAGVSVLVGMVF